MAAETFSQLLARANDAARVIQRGYRKHKAMPVTPTKSGDRPIKLPPQAHQTFKLYPVDTTDPTALPTYNIQLSPHTEARARIISRVTNDQQTQDGPPDHLANIPEWAQTTIHQQNTDHATIKSAFNPKRCDNHFQPQRMWTSTNSVPHMAPRSSMPPASTYREPYWASAPNTLERQHEQLLTSMVLDRLRDWGAHRGTNEWPRELVTPGPLPSVLDSLRCARSQTLTLPQLITALKERIGDNASGKAFDMLNLKAYVRCFPESFILHSGRTYTGRPLDAVELRGSEDSRGKVHQRLDCDEQEQDWSSNARQVVISALPSRPPLQPLAVAPTTSNRQAGCIPGYDPTPACRLEPRDLFGAATSGSLLPPAPADSWSPTHKRLDACDDVSHAALAQIHHLFDESESVTDLCPLQPPRLQETDSFKESRRQYMKRYDLDCLFNDAVDRAMLHNVSSPVEFVARELLRGAR